MKVLIIDNTIDRDYWGSPELCRLAHLNGNTTTWIRRAPHDDLPKNPTYFDRIIVSGSKTGATDAAPWIDQLLGFIEKAVSQKIPYLGVCYGHQMLIRALGGVELMRKAEQAEFGWIEIEQTQKSPLFAGIPERFHSFAAHFDEAAQLPSGMKLLAKSERCAIQAVQLHDLPIYGIQFHPEKGLEQAEKIIMERKKLKSPKELLNPKRGKELYQPNLGELLFKNFLNSESK